MEISAEALARQLGGALEGDADRILTGIAPLQEAGPNDLTFLYDLRYLPQLSETRAGAALVADSLQLGEPVQTTLIRVAQPYGALVQLLAGLEIPRPEPGVHPTAVLHPSVQPPQSAYIGPYVVIEEHTRLGEGACIHAGSYLGANCWVGPDSILYPRVTLYAGVHLGARCLVHSGAVLGSDGFGYLPQPNGGYKKIPQVGRVEIGDDVEIGANTCVDRATLGSTTVCDGVKLDNLIQVAHNCRIGQHTAVAAQAGISGSSKVGKFARIGGQVGVSGHLNLADHTQVAAQSGLTKSVMEPRQTLMGSPAYNMGEHLRSQAVFRKLPEMLNRLQDLEQEVQSLRNQLGQQD